MTEKEDSCLTSAVKIGKKVVITSPVAGDISLTLPSCEAKPT